MGIWSYGQATSPLPATYDPLLSCQIIGCAVRRHFLCWQLVTLCQTANYQTYLSRYKVSGPISADEKSGPLWKRYV